MAKSLRSKTKRAFRTQKRETVKQTPAQLEAEKRRQETMQAVLDGPKVTAEADQSGEGPSSMEADQHTPAADPLEAAMAVDGQPELTTKNPAKLLKKLKKARLAKVKGVVKGQKKKASLQKQGASAFMKKKKKH